MVIILENILFDLGKVDVKLEFLGIVKEMFSLFVLVLFCEIIVLGYMDNVFIVNV